LIFSKNNLNVYDELALPICIILLFLIVLFKSSKDMKTLI